MTFYPRSSWNIFLHSRKTWSFLWSFNETNECIFTKEKYGRRLMRAKRAIKFDLQLNMLNWSIFSFIEHFLIISLFLYSNDTSQFSDPFSFHEWVYQLILPTLNLTLFWEIAPWFKFFTIRFQNMNTSSNLILMILMILETSVVVDAHWCVALKTCVAN